MARCAPRAGWRRDGDTPTTRQARRRAGSALDEAYALRARHVMALTAKAPKPGNQGSGRAAARKQGAPSRRPGSSQVRRLTRPCPAAGSGPRKGHPPMGPRSGSWNWEPKISRTYPRARPPGSATLRGDDEAQGRSWAHSPGPAGQPPLRAARPASTPVRAAAACGSAQPVGGAQQPPSHLKRMPRCSTQISPGATCMRPNSVVISRAPCSRQGGAGAGAVGCEAGLQAGCVRRYTSLGEPPTPGTTPT